jgi:hypothetical protein
MALSSTLALAIPVHSETDDPPGGALATRHIESDLPGSVLGKRAGTVMAVSL